jgi:hypothetical protein
MIRESRSGGTGELLLRVVHRLLDQHLTFEQFSLDRVIAADQTASDGPER